MLAHLLLDRFGCIESCIKDLRVVYASLSSAFEIHDNCYHTHSTRDSITVHMNLFRTLDYESGVQGSGPWALYNSKIANKLKDEDVVVLNESPYIKGYLGERYMYFSKSEGRFLTNTERANVDQRKDGENSWPTLPTAALCRNILSYQGVTIPPRTNVQELFKTHNAICPHKAGRKTKGQKRKKDESK